MKSVEKEQRREHVKKKKELYMQLGKQKKKYGWKN